MGVKLDHIENLYQIYFQHIYSNFQDFQVAELELNVKVNKFKMIKSMYQIWNFKKSRFFINFLIFNLSLLKFLSVKNI